MRTKPYWTLFGVARGGCPTRRVAPRRGGARGRLRRPPASDAGSERCRPRSRGPPSPRTGPAPRPRADARPDGASVACVPYFDAASSAPLHPVARQALLASLDEGWADPARLYREGRRARLLLDAAREAAAEAVGCRPDELVFTPSGTQAVHAGIAGALGGPSACRPPAGASPPSSTPRCCMRPRPTRRPAARCTEVAVDRTGRVAAGGVRRRAAARTPRWPASSPPTTRWAPCSRWPRSPRLCRAAGVPLLVDAAQSLALGAGAGRLVAAGGERPQVGRPAGGRAARGAQGGAVRAPGPGGRAGVGAGARVREHPGDRGRRGLAAGGAGRGGGRGGAAAGAGGPDPGAGAGAGAGRGGGRRPGAAAAAPRHLLLSLRRRRGAAARAGPGGLLGLVRIVVHVAAR